MFNVKWITHEGVEICECGYPTREMAQETVREIEAEGLKVWIEEAT